MTERAWVLVGILALSPVVAALGVWYARTALAGGGDR